MNHKQEGPVLADIPELIERITQLESKARELREENARLTGIVTVVDDALIVNNVGPRKDGDYRKALHDLVTISISQERGQLRADLSDAKSDSEALRAALTGSREELIQLRADLDCAITLLRKAYDLLTEVPMSRPYNDRSAELRTCIQKFLKEHA